MFSARSFLSSKEQVIKYKTKDPLPGAYGASHGCDDSSMLHWSRRTCEKEDSGHLLQLPAQNVKFEVINKKST